jgi:hypothetical protein
MREQLKQKFERMRKEAVDRSEPTAFVLVEDRGTRFVGECYADLDIQSFPMKQFTDDYGDEAVIAALEQSRRLGWRTWLIDIFGEQFASESDAFELAWGNREYYHERPREYSVS